MGGGARGLHRHQFSLCQAGVIWAFASLTSTALPEQGASLLAPLYRNMAGAWSWGKGNGVEGHMGNAVDSGCAGFWARGYLAPRRTGWRF